MRMRRIFFYLVCAWISAILSGLVLGQTTHHHGRRRHPSSNSALHSSDPAAFSEQRCNSDHFQLLCALPYDGRPHEIDSSCGHCGDALESGLTGAKLTAELL
jgi:hypothetical protein